MKNLLFIILFITSLSTSAQMQIQWNNNFCCFDSIAPHSFSTPLGVVQMNDTIVIGYWEDSFFSIQLFNTLNGQFNGGGNFTMDTINPPLFYGGGFTKLNHGYAFLGIHTDNFANSKMILELLDAQFSPVATRIYPLSAFHFPPTKICVDNISGNYLFANITDSLHLYCYSSPGNLIWENILAMDSVVSVHKELFLLSDSTVVLTTLEETTLSGSVHVHFRKFDLSDGHFIQDLVYPDLQGIYHHFYFSHDTVTVAFENNSTNEILVKQIDLRSGTATPSAATGIQDVFGLQSIDQSPDGQNLYIWSDSYLLQLNNNLQLNYSRRITAESFPSDNSSHILFDPLQNPMLSFSYINNAITNHDLMMLRIDHTNGTTLDSITYNDARNTADHAMDQYLDVYGNLNIIFANDFDNFAILHEETQLGVLQIGSTASFVQQTINRNANLVLFPNPCSSTVQVRGDFNTNNIYQVTDLSGRIVNSGKMENGKIELPELKSGIYFFKILGSINFQGSILMVQKQTE